MNQLTTFLVAATIATLGVGCASPPSDTDADDPARQAAALELGRSVVEPSHAITALVAPFVQALRDGGTADTEDGSTIRARITSALSDAVAAAGCVSVSWTRASATVSFDACQLLDTGEVLDGSITVRVRILDRSATVTFDDVTVGTNRLDGSVTAALRRGALQLTTDVTADAGSRALVLDDLDLALSAAGVTASGRGQVVTPTLDAAATLDHVHWSRGDCLPSSGSVSDTSSSRGAHITFLPSTPETGAVELSLPPFPPATVTMFPACL